MSIATSTKNPFDLPEIIHRCSQYVTLKDAISCARVSRTWTDSFVSAIWFSIDFDSQSRFANLPPEAVTKNGHHIRIVKNAKTLPQVSALSNVAVNNIRQLHIDTAGTHTQHVQAYEIVFRNSLSLENLYIFAASVPVDKKDSLVYYVPVPALIPSPGVAPPTPSKLKLLKIERLWLTHDGLATILQGCPLLYSLNLSRVDIVGNPTQTFQHTGIKDLCSTYKSIFPALPTDHTLLSYFPNLTTLHAWNCKADSSISAVRIKNDTDQYCPRLTSYKLEGDTGSFLPELLGAIKKGIFEITVQYEHLSLEIIMAILLHMTTLKAVRQFLLPQGLDLEKEEVAPVSSHLQASARFFQLIPRGCSQLEILDLHSHEMDMDDVEQGEWVCKNLAVLRIRVKGLDTKEKILKAIALWRAGCWRRRQVKAGTLVEMDEHDPMDRTIEARVAGHLLNFEKLRIVWLGCQTWRPI